MHQPELTKVHNFTFDNILTKKNKTLKNSGKLLMIVGALLLLALFFTPLWRITLQAPQYPEGITMYIWIHQITGETPNTLQNINILNHYVGMQFIEPDSIPELTYFPFIVVGMVLTGLFAGIKGSKKLILLWLVIVLLLGVAAVYDFYLWEYDYGHNLDPKAPIKVPGQSYQPPVFGSKMLLNFTASSYPYWGGLALFTSIIFTTLSYVLIKKAGAKPAY